MTGGLVTFTEAFSTFEFQSNRSYTIPAFQIVLPSGNVSVGRINPIADDIAWDTITGEASELTPGGKSLSYRYVSSVVVRQGGTVLTEGTDYRVEYYTGSLYGLAKSGTVTVDFVAAKSRYDTLWWNPVTGALGGNHVTAHEWNPADFIAEVPAGMIPLLNVYFWKTAGVDNVQLIPTCAFTNGVAHGSEGGYAGWLAQARAMLPDTFKKLRIGTPVKIVGVGTSITRMAGDSIGYFQHYKADALALIPYSGLVGWNHAIKRKMEEAWGASVNYVNLGVDGNSSNAMIAPAQLDALIAEMPALVVIEAGQNEWGSTSIADNVASLIDTIRANGGEAIVIGVPPVSEYVWLSSPGYPSFASREATSEALARCAANKGVPFVSTYDLFGRGQEGAVGISRNSMGSANAFNHPGYPELKALGDRVAAIFA